MRGMRDLAQVIGAQRPRLGDLEIVHHLAEPREVNRLDAFPDFWQQIVIGTPGRAALHAGLDELRIMADASK